MATKQLLSLMAAAVLLLPGCGGSDDAGAKQAALAPAKGAKAVKAPDETVPKAAETATKAAAKPDAKSAPTAVVATAKAAETAMDSAGAPAQQDEALGRDSFSYTGGSRDPFVSLLATTKVGPELPDLQLVAIYYDTRNAAASVVVLREKIGNRKYNLRTGDRLGRMRVTGVRPKDVTFTIDDFGTERQETVSLRKQEDKQ